MCDQTEILYLDGDVVWVKLGPTWWPGEVLGSERVPAEVAGSLRKAPIAVVKFFREESLEIVKNLNCIYKYNCSRKHEFIKKGLDQFRSKHGHMELFPEYVREAETRTHGDPDIVTSPEFQPAQKVDYAGLFGARKTQGSPSKHKAKSSTSPSDSEYTPKITHPRILQKFLKGTSDYKVHILVQERERSDLDTDTEGSPATPRPASGHYTCHACPFSCTRINVMVLHNRCHSEGYVPYTPPKRHKPRPVSLSGKAKTPRPRGRPRAPRRLPEPSEPETPKQEKPKTDLEIKSSLLADWSEDSDESMDILSSLKLAENQSASETKEEDSDSNSATGDMDTKDDEKENSLHTENERVKDKASEDRKTCLGEDVRIKSSERKVASCFDFEDDDEDLPIETIGRKIPRLSIKSDDVSRKILETNTDIIEPLTKTEQKSSGAGDSPLRNSVVEDTLNLDMEINNLLEETAVPDMPSLPAEPKFVDSFIKSPEKDLESISEKEKLHTKSIFKTKTFFRSRHTRSQDAIEKYVADNTSLDKPPTYMEEPPEPDVPVAAAVEQPPLLSVSQVPAVEIKVPKFAPKIQLKKMKGSLGDKVNSPKDDAKNAASDLEEINTSLLSDKTNEREILNTNEDIETIAIKNHFEDQGKTFATDSVSEEDIPSEEIDVSCNVDQTATLLTPDIAERRDPSLFRDTVEEKEPIHAEDLIEVKQTLLGDSLEEKESTEHKEGEKQALLECTVGDKVEKNIPVDESLLRDVVEAKETVVEERESFIIENTIEEKEALLTDDSVEAKETFYEENIDLPKRNHVDPFPDDNVGSKSHPDSNIVAEEVTAEEKVLTESLLAEVTDFEKQSVETEETTTLQAEETERLAAEEEVVTLPVEESVTLPLEDNATLASVPDANAEECRVFVQERVENEEMEIETSKVSPIDGIQDRWNNESVDNLLKTSSEEERTEEQQTQTRTMNDILGTMEDNTGIAHHTSDHVDMESLVPNDSTDISTTFVCSSPSESMRKIKPQNIPTESDLQIAETLINLPTTGAPVAEPYVTNKMIENDQNFSAAKSLVQMSEALQSEQLPSVDAFSLDDSLVTKSDSAQLEAKTMPHQSKSQKKMPSSNDSSVEHSKLFQILDEPIKPKPKPPVKIIQNKPVQGKEKILNFQVGASPGSHKPRVIIRRSGAPRAAMADQQLVLTATQGDAQTFTIEQPRPKVMFPSLHKQKLVARPSNTIITSTGRLIQTSESAKDEEAFFDINSMPIVLSEEILSPENLDKIPTVMSDAPSASPRAKMKVTTVVQESPEAKREKLKTVMSSHFEKVSAPVKKYGQEAKMSNALLKPAMEKSASPNILSKSPKVKATKHLLVVDKTTGEQKIISTKSEEPQPSTRVVKHTPTILSQPHKAEKFIIVPSGAGSGPRTQKIIVNPQTGKSQIIIEEGGPAKGKTSTAKIIQNRSNVDTATGNTVMILTNAQGVQSKIVLTPEHQRILFPKGRKGSGPVVTSHTVLSPRSSQSIITSRGQLLSPVSGNALISSSVQLIPSRQARTVITAKPNQTILTSRGQLITTQSSPVTSQSKMLPQVTNVTSVPAPRPSRPKQGLLKAAPKPPGPTVFIKSSSGKLISADPTSILQGKKPGTVMHLTAAQFEHLQKTGQIITTQQPSLNQIVSSCQNKANPGKMQTQKFILQKYASNSKQMTQPTPKPADKRGETSGVKHKLSAMAPSQPAPPPLKKQKLRELLTIKADSGTKKYPSPVSRNAAAQPPVMDLGNLDDLIPATTISTCKGETRTSHSLQKVLPTVSSPATSQTQTQHRVSSEVIVQRPEPVPESPALLPEEAPPALAGDGQLLAVPGENFGGPANSFYLCMEENGTLTPVDNQPLMLENNQLVPMVIPPVVAEQQVILNAGDQQILVDQQTLLSLLGGERAGAEGQQLLLQGDMRQLLAALAPQAPPHSQDILAAALADTGDSLLMEMDTLGSEYQHMNVGVSVHSNVSETSTTLKPIMSVTEQPSKKRSPEEGNAGRLPPPGKLEDSLAALGVTPSNVPTSLDLPITVTDPRIAPKTFPALEEHKPDTTHTTASLLTRVSQTNQQSHLTQPQHSSSLPSHEKSFSSSREKSSDFRRTAKQPASSMPCLDDSSSDSFASDNPQQLTEAIQTKTYSPISMPLLTEDTVEEAPAAAPPVIEEHTDSPTEVKSMPVLLDSEDSVLQDTIDNMNSEVHTSEERSESSSGQLQSEVSAQENQFVPDLAQSEPNEVQPESEMMAEDGEVIEHTEVEHDETEHCVVDNSAPIMDDHGDSDVIERSVPDIGDMSDNNVTDIRDNVPDMDDNVPDMDDNNVPDMDDNNVPDMPDNNSLSDMIEHNASDLPGHCVSDINDHNISEHSISDLTDHRLPDMMNHEASHMIDQGISDVTDHVITDTTIHGVSDMTEQDVSDMTDVIDHGEPAETELNIITEPDRPEIVVPNMTESGDHLDEIFKHHNADEQIPSEPISANGNVESSAPPVEYHTNSLDSQDPHLDIAPSSVPSEACSSPEGSRLDVLPSSPEAAHHYSDSSSDSSTEIPIQPSISVSQQHLAQQLGGSKRSPSPCSDGSRASPKRFKFDDER